jgi:hypothetical protein
MGFLKGLKRLLAGAGPGPSMPSDPRGLWFHFRCKKCGSVVAVRADKMNDLNREDGPGAFVLRKDVMDKKCFQLMHAEIWLDEGYGIVSSEISGGDLITAEEYQAAMAK